MGVSADRVNAQEITVLFLNCECCPRIAHSAHSRSALFFAHTVANDVLAVSPSWETGTQLEAS